MPISFTRTGQPEIEHRSSPVRPDVEELIQLTATGLNDKKIASESRISIRTLERRVADLINEMGTQTRFQAGWLAALRLCNLEALPGRHRDTKPR